MRRIDLVGYVGATISLYGYLSLNFMNFGNAPVFGALDATFGWIYLHTFNLLVPYENWNFGLIAGIYFICFLSCFMVLNRNIRPAQNIRTTIALTSAIVLLTEVGIYLSQPYFLNVYVISAQAGTVLSGFTNLDLMLVSAFCLVLTSTPAGRLTKLVGQPLL